MSVLSLNCKLVLSFIFYTLDLNVIYMHKYVQ
jgi:hypothetical protein